MEGRHRRPGVLPAREPPAHRLRLRDLPGDGLLIWHIDESQPDNTDENHYKVGLVQADGNRDLELEHNRGDDGDPYPGSAGNTQLLADVDAQLELLRRADTCVSVT